MYRKHQPLLDLKPVCLALVMLLFSATAWAETAGYQSKSTEIDGVNIHYLTAGNGPTPLVLMHGFAETSHMWIPLFPAFSKNFTIVAPDLPGLGGSSRPESGYDKKTVAQLMHGLVKSLGFEQIDLVGHDIGLMVAYAYAAQYPGEVRKLALLEAPIPGIGEQWDQIYSDGRLWHFHFVDSQFALPLVQGRERIFLNHFWVEMTPNPAALSEADQQFYTQAYAQDGSMWAAFELFKAFNKADATDNREFATRKLTMPVLVITGDSSMGTVLEAQADMVADNVTSIIFANTGHWLIDERPRETEAALLDFFTE